MSGKKSSISRKNFLDQILRISIEKEQIFEEKKKGKYFFVESSEKIFLQFFFVNFRAPEKTFLPKIFQSSRIDFAFSQIDKKVFLRV